MSRADDIFCENINDILTNGVWDKQFDVRPRWADGERAYTIKKFGIVNRYRLDEEFPIITIRKTNLPAAIDELLWIWQKKSNNVKDLNSRIWDSWADSNGSIGKAYGYQLGVKHSFIEGLFDQVDRLLFDLKHNPQSRRMIVNMYNHADLKDMALYPCAYSLTLNVSDGKINAILNQRSQDMLTANNWNVAQYSILIHMLSNCSNLQVGELVHVIADAHIYDRHIPICEKIINNPRLDAPKLIINKRENFYDYRVEDFALEGYNYTELKEKIEVAI